VIVRWDGTAWQRENLGLTELEGVLTGIARSSDGVVWAVGWRWTTFGIRPLVLRRGSGVWAVVPGPDPGGAFALLTDVTTDEAGRPWVVGAVYRDATERYAPVAARFRAGEWTSWPQVEDTGLYVVGADGDLVSDGWLVGKGYVGTVQAQLCEPSIPRGPRRDGPPYVGPSGRMAEDAARDLPPRPAPGLPNVPRIPKPRKATTFTMRDVAESVGLGGDRVTHGATVGDLDGDGLDDVFLSQHGQPASIWLRRDGGYEQAFQDAFHRTDRHGCDVGRVDPGPTPDIVCAIGADRGVGIKANEVWLDPAAGAPVDVGTQAGASDPTGRGRKVVLFDADGDGDDDLYLGNHGLRYDAFPSPNRLLLNDGSGRFAWDPASGLTSDRGAWCVVPGDIDRDGDTDLLVCGSTGRAGDVASFAVYRNDHGRFQQEAGALGVQTIGEMDAAIVDLGGSARPDLVQLSQRRLRVSIWRDGRFRPVYERSLTQGWALAVGDVDGDGAADIYVQRGGSNSNAPDLLLSNDGSGRSFSPVDIPQVATGTAEDVVAFDHDGNGRTDFLVLNGRSGPGPIQLIAWYPGK
jgi:hypothetical protein